MAESGTNSRSRHVAVGLALALVVLLLTPTEATAATGTTTRVSVASDGTAGDQQSLFPALTADGRFVAFESSATNLVAGDTNGVSDVFVHDKQSGVTERVSVDTAGRQGNARSGQPALTDDGRYVAFYSDSSNLVPGDTNAQADVFVRDRLNGSTERVSVAHNEAEGNGSSAGRPAISADGQDVAFQSDATNLLPEDENGLPQDTNRSTDVFVRDRENAFTQRVSLPAVGGEALGNSTNPAISGDGRYVAFQSSAANMVGLGADTNNADDVFLHDTWEWDFEMVTRRMVPDTSMVSVATDGTKGNGASRRPAISADGLYVAFDSASTNLVSGDDNSTEDVFVHRHRVGFDQDSDETTLASVAADGTAANGGSRDATISADGRYVAFQSEASDLVAADTNDSSDVFARDRQGSVTSRMSLADNGAQAANGLIIGPPDVSDDGRYAVFDNRASNLVAGDTNDTSDVFLHDMQSIGPPPPVLVAIGDVAVHEGDALTRAAVFTVSLSEPAATTVTVGYATGNGNATGTDFTAKEGTLSFAAGVTSLSVTVPVTGDTDDEGNETFTVTLSAPTGASLGDGTGLGTILDDDPPAVSGLGVAIGDVAVHEGEAGGRSAVFTVSLSKASTSKVSVSFATSEGSATGSDFTANSGKLNFAAGTTSLTVEVAITADTATEGDEYFSVKLSNARGATIADTTATGTVVDDD